MIKLSGKNKDDGKLFLGFGLSRGNIDKLTAGNPIVIDLAEVSVPTGIKLDGSLLIFFGETEEQMTDWIAEFIGPDTKVTVAHSLKS